MHHTCRALEAVGELCLRSVRLGEPVAEMVLAIFADGSKYTCPPLPLMAGAGDTIRGLVHSKHWLSPSASSVACRFCADLRMAAPFSVFPPPGDWSRKSCWPGSCMSAVTASQVIGTCCPRTRLPLNGGDCNAVTSDCSRNCRRRLSTMLCSAWLCSSRSWRMASTTVLEQNLSCRSRSCSSSLSANSSWCCFSWSTSFSKACLATALTSSSFC
mmetsp:Transcript_2939/g.5571  ORF Transcript_2939/g.5571 Transcript_2939/m.5571 type:complete len:214 (-) Transcript_2939:69-710(-)